jgi:hypothetical protein
MFYLFGPKPRPLHWQLSMAAERAACNSSTLLFALGEYLRLHQAIPEAAQRGRGML